MRVLVGFVLVAVVVLVSVAGVVAVVVLVVAAVPVAGFTVNQMRLTGRGASLATSVGEVRALKESDAAAFGRPLAVLLRRPREARLPDGRNCTVVYTDIAGFSAPVRDDRDRMAVRKAMYGLLQEAFGGVWGECHREDRGDGALIVVPPEVPTGVVVELLVGRLARGLDVYNRRACSATRIQLRVAVEVGPVTPDEEGVNGEAVIRAARLLDASVLKRRLAETGADLGLIASGFVHDAVVRHLGLEPFEEVDVTVKESCLTGHIHLAGRRAPVLHPVPRQAPAVGPAPRVRFRT